MNDTLDLSLTVCDRQLVDCQGHRCGRVDDIEFSTEHGGCELAYLLVGQGAAAARLPRPLRALVSRLAKGEVVRVPWSDVYQVSHVVKLSRTDVDLGLGKGERRAARWLARFPGASR
jgi:sporulation protein YlmC with PRC-barrel domain